MTDYGEIPVDGSKQLPYISTPDTDIILADLWAKMRHAGDLQRLFTKDSQSLSAFYKIMAKPTVLLWHVADPGGVWSASWFSPCMNGCFVGTWIAPSHRKKKAGLAAILEAYHQAFQHYDVLLGISKQEKMLDEMARLGYAVLGRVPHLWDGESAWVVMLTREQWWRYTLPRYGRLIGVTHAAEVAEEVVALGPVGR